MLGPVWPEPPGTEDEQQEAVDAGGKFVAVRTGAGIVEGGEVEVAEVDEQLFGARGSQPGLASDL